MNLFSQDLGMKNFLFNMGYDTSHIVSVLSKEGVEDGSRVILLVPEKTDERQENAINEIRTHLDSLSMGVELETFPVGESVEKDVLELSKLLSRAENLVLSLSGGPRDFLVPLTVASVFEGNRIEKIYFRSDLDSDLQEIDLPEALIEAGPKHEEVLAAIDDGFISARKIKDETSLSESTVYRKLNELEEKGLVRKEGSYSLTPTGRLFLE